MRFPAPAPHRMTLEADQADDRAVESALSHGRTGVLAIAAATNIRPTWRVIAALERITKRQEASRGM